MLLLRVIRWNGFMFDLSKKIYKNYRHDIHHRWVWKENILEGDQRAFKASFGCVRKWLSMLSENYLLHVDSCRKLFHTVSVSRCFLIALKLIKLRFYQVVMKMSNLICLLIGFICVKIRIMLVNCYTIRQRSGNSINWIPSSSLKLEKIFTFKGPGGWQNLCACEKINVFFFL